MGAHQPWSQQGIYLQHGIALPVCGWLRVWWTSGEEGGLLRMLVVDLVVEFSLQLLADTVIEQDVASTTLPIPANSPKGELVVLLRGDFTGEQENDPFAVGGLEVVEAGTVEGSQEGLGWLQIRCSNFMVDFLYLGRLADFDDMFSHHDLIGDNEATPVRMLLLAGLHECRNGVDLRDI